MKRMTYVRALVISRSEDIQGVRDGLLFKGGRHILEGTIVARLS